MVSVVEESLTPEGVSYRVRGLQSQEMRGVRFGFRKECRGV
jgi:hypothetical protein